MHQFASTRQRSRGAFQHGYRVGSTVEVSFGSMVATFEAGTKDLRGLGGHSTFLLDAFPNDDPPLPGPTLRAAHGRLVEPYHLDVRLPDLQAGTYRVSVYSGGGGKLAGVNRFSSR